MRLLSRRVSCETVFLGGNVRQASLNEEELVETQETPCFHRFSPPFSLFWDFPSQTAAIVRITCRRDISGQPHCLLKLETWKWQTYSQNPEKYNSDYRVTSGVGRNTNALKRTLPVSEL